MNIQMNVKKAQKGRVFSRGIAFALCLFILVSLATVTAFADDTMVVLGGAQAVNNGFSTASASVSGNTVSQPVGVVIGAESTPNNIMPISNGQQTVVSNGNKDTVVVVSDGVKTSTVTVSTAASNAANGSGMITVIGNIASNVIPNGAAQTTSDPDAGITVAAATVSGLRAEIFEKTNAFRTENGLTALSYNNDLQAAANTRAQESAVQFNHVRPDGSEAYTVVTVDYNITGENLIQAENRIVTADTLMETWKNSGTHRMNLLHPSYKSMAVGIYQENGMTFVSQVFIG